MFNSKRITFVISLPVTKCMMSFYLICMANDFHEITILEELLLSV